MVKKTNDEADGTKDGVEQKIIEAENIIFRKVQRFLKMEASGGIVLMVAAVAAMIIANSPLLPYYEYFLDDIQFKIGFKDLEETFRASLEKSLRLWINDGLMAIFFFLVGLEIKKEFFEGELSSRDRALLPMIGAVGGIAAPAIVFYLINMDYEENMRGWAIPTATDIAFALGIASLLGSRVPTSLKVLLTAIAIMDDIAAIMIIAVFYTAGVKMTALYIAGGCVVLLAALNFKGVRNLAPYILIIFVLWVCVLKSGVHATIAGVLGAMFIPLTSKKNKHHSPLIKLEHALHPWVAFGVLPIFALANAGVPLYGMTFEDLFNPLSIGIILGLIIGKPVGIFLLLWLTIIIGLSPKPRGATWTHLFAVSMMCGIGFTMSLFIGGLAFEDLEKMHSVRFGVICASVIAALLSYFILRTGPTRGLDMEEVIGEIDDDTVPDKDGKKPGEENPAT